MPAQAQTTSRVLVTNLGQGADDSVSTSGNAHAQLFNTGNAMHGYTLTSVVVPSEDTQGDDFDVDICAVDNDGFPISVCTALQRPGTSRPGTWCSRTPALSSMRTPTTP